jgi:D-alanyl-D-alanine-carboxypeptidase/D-alanyl-D-alanine-endopeptidase
LMDSKPLRQRKVATLDFDIGS